MNKSKGASREENSDISEMLRIRLCASDVDAVERTSAGHSDQRASRWSIQERLWSQRIGSLVSVASSGDEKGGYRQSGSPTMLEVDRGTEFRSITLGKIIEGLGLELCIRSPHSNLRGNEAHQSDPERGELLPELGAK